MSGRALSDSLFQQAVTLPIGDRVEFLQRLWESLPQDSGGFFLTPELLAELDGRLAHEDAHPNDDFSWDEVKDGVPRPS